MYSDSIKKSSLSYDEYKGTVSYTIQMSTDSFATIYRDTTVTGKDAVFKGLDQMVEVGNLMPDNNFKVVNLTDAEIRGWYGFS